MKLFIFLLLICTFSFHSCKPKQKTNDQEAKTVAPVGATLGKVSHQYRKTGCATVIIVHYSNPEEMMTLIPKDTLAPAFDIDGLEIYFNYRKLKMPNPRGCTAGMPAEIKDISKK